LGGNDFEPRAKRPEFAWAVFAAVLVGLCLSHLTLLRLPYFWDEAGYYIPAAWDFFRTGSLIPLSTLTNAHPPLPSVWLAVAWKFFGFSPLVTRLAVVVMAALGLTAVWRLAMRLVGVPSVAFWTLLLTALYPVWFAQSTLAHADIFAAAGSLWGLYFALPGREKNDISKPWAAFLCFSAAALAKETAIVIPLTLAGAGLVEGFRGSALQRWKRWSESVWLLACALPLAGWYGYHKLKTGFLFGNPEFLRYNAKANLSPLRFLAAFGHRLLHLSAHMNLFVPVLLALGALSFAEIREQESGNKDQGQIEATTLRLIFVLLGANALFFSVLGGALLTRYLLPMYPLVLLVAVTTLYRRVRGWQALAALSAAAFVVGLFVNPPYGFAPEDNLAYAHAIRLHQAAIAELNARYAGATVLTAWPASDELTRPELGYLSQPYDVYRLEDFSAEQIAHAAEEPGRYSAALVFSTKYDPASPLFTLGAKSKALDERYFGLHHDLSPEAIARKLGGEVVWEKTDQGQWAAVIRFNRQYDARVDSFSGLNAPQK
jgi:4-amino-4-deoxy-L-arabinose transferase-like glycosyltransferase